jgi:hypothetical protein
VALKICIASQRLHREIEVLKHIAATQSKHSGSFFVRTLETSFELEGPAGIHKCLVQEPLLASLSDLQNNLSPKSLTEDMLKTALQQVFAGLDYLHSQAHVIHTGKLQPRPSQLEILLNQIQISKPRTSCSAVQTQPFSKNGRKLSRQNQVIGR